MSTPGDYIAMLLVAAVCGAIGGLAFELLATSPKGRSGVVRLPYRSKSTSPRRLYWGVAGNMLIGAIAAVAILWLIPPASESKVVKGVTHVTYTFDVIKVVALSLIVGSAGGSFIAALQARATALVSAEQVASTARIATTAIDEAKAQLAADRPGPEVAATLTAAKAAVVANSTANGNPPEDAF